MKQSTKDILILAAITVPAILFLLFTVGTGTIDLQMHDTYVVLDSFSLAVLIIGPVVLLVFLVLAVARKFKTVSTNFGLITGLILVSLIVFGVVRMQSSFRDLFSMTWD